MDYDEKERIAFGLIEEWEEEETIERQREPQRDSRAEMIEIELSHYKRNF
nr:hypothetical protein [Ectobacillus panaciterrae]